MRAANAVVLTYALLALILIPVYPHFVSPNELTRWLLAAAIVEERTIEVSRPAALLGPRFEDLAERDGRLYSNKAPGLAFLSLPGYVAARPFAGPPSSGSIRMTANAMRVAGATIPLLLLAILFIRLGGRLGIGEQRIAIVVFVLLFATPLFAYGLLLFSHAVVAAALFGGWALLFARERAPRTEWTAGVLLAVAVASEYPAAVPVAVIVVALAIAREWRTLLRVVAGAAPIAAALMVYQHLAFGSAFRLSPLYDRLPEYRELGRSGLFGLQFPSPSIALRLLFDPGRGLLVFAPIVLLAIPALAHARRALSPIAFRTMLAIPAVLFVVYASYPNWHGGWAVGPRYLTACLPFLVLPLLFRDGAVWESLLSGWSAAAIALTALVFPFVPNAFPFPWMTLSIPLLADGLIAPNVFHLMSRPLAIAIPLALVVLAAALALRRRTLAAAAGLALVLALGLTGSRLASEPLLRLQRAYIADVYFEQHGALEQAGPPPSLLRRREMERTLPPASWPF